MLSSVFVDKGKGRGKCIVGDGSGVLTLWEKGAWEDQDERIIIDRAGKESLDVLAKIPDDLSGGSNLIAVGMGDGRISIVQVGINKVVSEIQHDEVDSVLGLGFAVGGWMISGGGTKVKVWGESVEEDSEDSDGNDGDSEGDGDNDGEEEEGEGVGDGTTLKRRKEDSDGDSGSEGDEQEKSSSEEEERKRKKKKRKRGSGRGGVKPVLGFKGLD